MQAKKKILVVDDETDMRTILSFRLEINDYEVITASDGEEGLRMVKSENPDLLVLDLMLPKMTGFELCRMLKYSQEYKDIPVIILSALDQQEDRKKATESGADAYFIKPFDLELLLVKINSFLSK